MPVDKCIYCAKTSGENSDWVGCVLCETWAHTKCASLSSLKKKELLEVNWICLICKEAFNTMKTTIAQLKKRIQDLDGISNKIDGLVTKIEDVKSEVITKIDSVAPVSNDSGTNTYADALKNAKKSASRKHLLVVEPNTADASVDDMKPEVGAALTGIQVADSKFLEKKIVLNFETMAERDAAAQKVRNVQNVTVKEVKKLDPCIMICNVAQAESKDELMKNLLERNEYLQSVADIGKKIKHVFNKVAAGGTRHCTKM